MFNKSLNYPVHYKLRTQDCFGHTVVYIAYKAANNVVVVCRLHYITTLKQELSGTKAYEETSIEEKSAVTEQLDELPF